MKILKHIVELESTAVVEVEAKESNSNLPMGKYQRQYYSNNSTGHSKIEWYIGINKVINQSLHDSLESLYQETEDIPL